MSENNYVSVSISKDVKEKLLKIKGDKNLSYTKIIENLIEQTGGVIVEDVISIQREQTAFTLKYWDNLGGHKIRDVKYVELRGCRVGEEFTVCDEPVGDNWVSSSAKVVAKDGVDVILLVKDFSCNHGVYSELKSVVHVSLF